MFNTNIFFFIIKEKKITTKNITNTCNWIDAIENLPNTVIRATSEKELNSLFQSIMSHVIFLWIFFFKYSSFKFFFSLQLYVYFFSLANLLIFFYKHHYLPYSNIISTHKESTLYIIHSNIISKRI